MIRNFIRHIASLGTHESQTVEERQAITLANSLAMLAVAAPLLSLPQFILLEHEAVRMVTRCVILTAVVVGITPVLNHYRMHTLASTWLLAGGVSV